MYSIDGGPFSTNLPIYNQSTAVSIRTRCDCDGGADVSLIATVTTQPGTCPIIGTISNLSISDPCSCDNPLNLTVNNTFLFQDILAVTTTPDVTVTLSATDGNLLTATGIPIPVGTVIPQTAPGSGIYQLSFFTQSETPASVTVSNGANTENFTTASCTSCISTIPTMSEWGLMIFGLLMLNMGVVFLKRREELLAVA